MRVWTIISIHTDTLQSLACVLFLLSSKFCYTLDIYTYIVYQTSNLEE